MVPTVCEYGKPRMKIVSVVKGQLVDKTASGNIQRLCISVLGRILWGLYTPCIRIGLIANISLYSEHARVHLSSPTYTLPLCIPPIPHSHSPSFFPSTFAS